MKDEAENPETKKLLDQVSAELKRLTRGYIGQRNDDKLASKLTDELADVMAEATQAEFDKWVKVRVESKGGRSVIHIEANITADTPRWVVDTVHQMEVHDLHANLRQMHARMDNIVATIKQYARDAKSHDYKAGCYDAIAALTDELKKLRHLLPPDDHDKVQPRASSKEETKS